MGGGEGGEGGKRKRGREREYQFRCQKLSGGRVTSTQREMIQVVKICEER